MIKPGITMPISVLVLIYNEKPHESLTMQSILSSGVDLRNFRIVVWNNGPQNWEMYDIDWIQSSFPVTVIAQTIDNRSLSWIYNTFIDDFPSEKYVFLDDDSAVTSAYLLDVVNYQGGYVAVPAIFSDGFQVYPKVGGVLLKTFESSNGFVDTVGSGLVVHNNVIQKLKMKFSNVFDNKFVFYGVDTTFMIRLHLMNQTDKITAIHGFEHSLSSAVTESKKTKQFRKKERGYSLGAICRNYSQYQTLKYGTKMVVASCFLEKDIGVSSFLYGYLIGKHKNVKVYSNDEIYFEKIM